MGQVIDFGGKPVRKTVAALSEADLIKLLPKLRILKGEDIVIHIGEKVLENNDLLTKLLREVVTLKCMEATVLLIPDTDIIVSSFCDEHLNINNPFKESNFVNAADQIDVFDVIFKRDVISKISNILKSFNSMSLGISGHSLDIVFPDELVNNGLSVFDRQRYDVGEKTSDKKNKKYSIDMLDELLKTDIIPIIAPTFKDRIGKTYIFESYLFGAYLSSYLSSLKYVEVYTDKQNIPTNCIYGVERFMKIVKSSCFSDEDLQIINAGMVAIQKGVQGVHVVDIDHISLLEEFCRKTFSGLFLYDDTLNQI